MALFELTISATPTDISALLGVSGDVSILARGQNLGQATVYRAVGPTAPTNADGAVFRYQPGESFDMSVTAGATNGNTYLMTGSGTSRVVIENNIPGN